MYNPERAAMHAIDGNRERRIELSPILEKAHTRAHEEILSNPEYVIQERDFDGVYEPGSIERDIAHADRLERGFEADRTLQDRNTKKVSDTFEAIMLTQSEMSEWLGSNASTLKTSRFDDYMNKVDMIAEWKNLNEGSNFLALAVDVTFGAQQIEKKLTAIRHEIEAGKLGEIRYFRDEAGDIMGRRKNVARTVVGISQPVIEELASLWMDGKNKVLGQHAMQRVMVDQMEFQLSQMHQYALKLRKYEIAQAYQQSLTGIQKVRVEKRDIQVGALAQDPVHREIFEQTRAQFS